MDRQPVSSAAEPILRTLYALDEPWRCRFLILTAQLATGWRWDGREPERAEVEAWLSDHGLQMSLRALLYIWTGGGTRCLRAKADGSPS